MEALISLPFDLQMILVAGFLAYKVSIIGRGVSHSTEDFLLQVVAFGSVARGVAMAIEAMTGYVPDNVAIVDGGDAGRILALGALTAVFGLIIGMLWRRWLSSWVSQSMRDLKIYRDDHEHSAWASLTLTKNPMTVVQIHLTDGRMVEADFDGSEEVLPMRPITFNDDGVVVFATAIYLEGESEALAVERNAATFGYTATYIPKDQIKSMDVSMKKANASA